MVPPVTPLGPTDTERPPLLPSGAQLAWLQELLSAKSGGCSTPSGHPVLLLWRNPPVNYQRLKWSYDFKKILGVSLEGRVAHLQSRLLWTNVFLLRKDKASEASWAVSSPFDP